MNEHENDELATRLTRTLTDHADVMAGSSLALATVQGRARRIRRRRAATAVVAAAAAVAVVVPTVALASHTGGKPEPAPATQTPVPTQTATDDGHQPKPGILDVSDLPTGDAPAVDYVLGGQLHFHDGGSGELHTRYTPDRFVEMDDGSRVWHTADHGTPYIEIQDADGTFHDPVRTTWSLAVNPAHTISAWLTPQGQVVVWEARASDPRPLGDPIPGSDLRLAAITGDQCDLACTVIVNVTDAQGGWQPWEVSDAGSHKLLDGGYLMVKDVSAAGLTAGLTKITDFGSCSTLSGAGEFRGFSTCKNQLESFSPDGSLVLGYPPYYDGLGPSSLAMLDAGTGKVLFERGSDEKTQSFFTDAFWEDGSHVLAPVFQDGKWALVRIAPDGSMEYAVAPVAGDMDHNPFVLATNSLYAGVS